MKLEKRGTGRTTRMLEHAIEKADKGVYVFVVAATNDHALLLRQQLCKMCEGKIAGTKVYTKANGQISVESSENKQFEWDRMSFIGAHPSCETLVDHYAIESRFRNILEMLTRFDQKNERSQTATA